MTSPGTEPTPPADDASASSAEAPPTDAPPSPAVPTAPVLAHPIPAAPVPPAPVPPPAPVSPAVTGMPLTGIPAMAGADSWNRGSATTYPPTYSGGQGYPHPAGVGGFGPGGTPPTFDTPGYGYGYPGAPVWAPRIDGPKAWPVAVFTVLFGAFGAISAARRSSDARALGLPSGRYWGTFAGSLVASFAVWAVIVGVVTAVTVPLYLASTATVMTAPLLEQELSASSSANGVVTDATCIEDSVDPLGVGTYACLVRYDDGADLPYRITVSGDGTWAATATE